MTHMEEGQSGGEVLFNECINMLDECHCLMVQDMNDNSPPGSPAEGVSYELGDSPTGDWSGHANEIAVYFSGWHFFTPAEGYRLYDRTANEFMVYDGSNWLEVPKFDSADFLLKKITDSITASTTQTQGQMPLTAEVNRVTVCANADDVVTLPSAAVGRTCVVINQGAQQLQVFPASGDRIQGLAIDASATVPSTTRLILYGVTASDWE